MGARPEGARPVGARPEGASPGRPKQAGGRRIILLIRCCPAQPLAAAFLRFRRTRSPRCCSPPVRPAGPTPARAAGGGLSRPALPPGAALGVERLHGVGAGRDGAACPQLRPGIGGHAAAAARAAADRGAAVFPRRCRRGAGRRPAAGHPGDHAGASARVGRRRRRTGLRHVVPRRLRAVGDRPAVRGIAARAEAAFSAPVFEIYGCSEAGQLATRRTVDGPVWRCLDGFRLYTDAAGCWAAGPDEADVLLADEIEPVGDGGFILRGRTADLVNVAGKRSSLALPDASACWRSRGARTASS